MPLQSSQHCSSRVIPFQWSQRWHVGGQPPKQAHTCRKACNHAKHAHTCRNACNHRVARNSYATEQRLFASLPQKSLLMPAPSTWSNGSLANTIHFLEGSLANTIHLFGGLTRQHAIFPEMEHTTLGTLREHATLGTLNHVVSPPKLQHETTQNNTKQRVACGTLGMR
jgi:hypothetical protein